MNLHEHSLFDNTPKFVRKLHSNYIATLAAKLDSKQSFEGALTEHLKVSGVYWSVTALSLIEPHENVDELLGLTKAKDGREPIVEFVWACFDEASGGFGGNKHQDGHLLYTLSALQILAIADKLNDERLPRDKVVDFIAGLQQEDGSFAGDSWGEIDTRFTYCALSALSLLGRLDAIDVDRAADYVLQCRNLDGGFGCVIGAESHAGQVFCCIGALSIAKRLHSLGKEGIDLLSWWLAERQVDSGGLNGRPEKQSDVCYSWWILSALSILGRTSWINRDKLAGFILNCQDDEDGGIADRPADAVDAFHTFFGIAGLSLLGCLHKDGLEYRAIDPIYALPTDVTARLKLQGQVARHANDYIDKRLEQYESQVIEES